MLMIALTCAASVASGSFEHILPLQTGEVRVEAMTRTARSAELARLSWQSDHPHAIVVLNHADAAADLTADGLTLLRSLGGSTWIAAVAPAAADSTRVLDAVSWIGAINPTWKVHSYLASGGVPDWTIDQSASTALIAGERFDMESLLRELDEAADPRVVVYMLAHRDVSLDALAVDLPVLADAAVLSKLNTVHGLTVAIPMSAIVPLAEDDRVLWIEPAMPRFNELNDQNREVTQANDLQEPPYGLDGEGVVVMVYDGGKAFGGHADFGGRLTERDTSSTSDHATHVSGTIGGDGSASGGQYRGMAPAVTIESYGFEQEGGLQEGFLYTDPGDLEADYGNAINNYGAVIANNSIGTNTAPNGFPCEWTGNYGITSSVIDAVVRGELGGNIRIMWANGNERGSSNCGTSFYSTAPPATAKNHITVGALNSNDESITYFTSWGPTDDGRIKPDISTAGCQSDGDGGVTSCSSSGGYSSKCGTSMASPTACGIGALLIQDWRTTYPGEPDMMNSTLKAMLAHTAADLGNVGPDCKYGYGSIRAEAAVDHLRSGSLIEAEVANGDSFEFLVIVNAGDPQLQVTLAWDDAPATPLVVPSLVNDLDLVVLGPDGNRHYPWAIDPADPGAPATKTAEDHLNNIEQVTVALPQAGVWRVQVVGFSVPIGPQAFGVMATPDLVACSRTGIVGLDRGAYPLEGDLSVTIVDCDLNTDDTVTDSVDVFIRSDDEPDGEWFTLYEEDPAASIFSGTMPHSTTDAPGTILALHGSTIEAIYIDAEDANGNTGVQRIASAVVDGESPELIMQTAIAGGPGEIQFSATSSELSSLTVRVGQACNDLSRTIGPSGLDTDHSEIGTGFDHSTTYYYTIELVDQAGNTASFDNNGACWMVDTLDIPNYFTEQYGSFDLDGMMIHFTPNSTFNGYTGCAEPIESLPVNPLDGTSLSLSDDDFETISPATSVTLHGETYSQLYVGSNGFVTFNSGQTGYTESLSDHFSQPRISLLWDDLNPAAGGTVSWKNTIDGVVITWQDVPEYGTSNSNTFQLVMHTDDSLTLAWVGIDSADSIVGLSAGNGLDPNYFASDLSDEDSGCESGLPGDANGDGVVDTNDLLLIISGWGPCPPAPCPADVNGDGVVDTDDILLVIANWGNAGSPRSAGHADDEEDASNVSHGDRWTSTLLINDELFKPSLNNGLIATSGSYLQQPWATLDLEVAGDVPMIDRDLMVIGGTAWLDGTLIIRLTDDGVLSAGRHPLLVAKAFEGWFGKVSIFDPLDRGAKWCLSEQSLSIILPLALNDAQPEDADPQQVLAALDALGTPNSTWDLNEDGLVSELDLIELLDGGACPE
jgi:hypothetical protein